MGVLQRHPATIGAPDVADHVGAFDRIAANEPSNFRLSAWARVVEAAASLAIIEGDAPAVGMRTGLTAPAHQAGEAEADIGRNVGVHAQKLAHAIALRKSGPAVERLTGAGSPRSILPPAPPARSRLPPAPARTLFRVA